MMDQVVFKKTATAAAVTAFLAIQCGVALAQAAPAQDRSTIQEVSVTAQRIAQPASKTPLSPSVVSDEDLKQAGAVNATSLTELVPRIPIANHGGATLINIGLQGDVRNIENKTVMQGYSGVNAVRGPALANLRLRAPAFAWSLAPSESS